MAVEGRLLLDTHAWLWLQAGTLTAAPKEFELIRRAGARGDWFISSFSLCEIAQAVSRKRLVLNQPLISWFQHALLPPGPQTIDISPEIAAHTLQLPESFHGDPGDRILAATARFHNLTLCTHDDQLLRFAKGGLFSAIKVREKKDRHAR